MKPIKTALLIEDNAGDARLLSEMFRDGESLAVVLSHVECMSDAEQHLARHSADVILLDPGLPDTEGLESVRRIRAAAPGIPLVVLTGLDDEDFAAQALRDGAQDYLIKNEIEPRGLMRALRYAYERNRLEQMKEDFVATVSHELRTPLTSISGSLALLMNNAAGNLPGPVARLLTIAHTNCQRLVRLINDILDMEKIESGKVVFAVKRIDVRALVEQAIDANRGFAQGYGVHVKLEPSSRACEIAGDADWMAQVVTNLLANAIKFSERGQEVVIAIEKRTSTIRLSVRDHGSGMPENFKSRVFEKFAQADNSDSRQKGGTGLGLSIVKQIVTRLGGEVSFEDAPGGGTVFYADLPDWDHRSNLGTTSEKENTESRASAPEAALLDSRP
jgi:signal transduction histidine kinase